VEFDAVEARFLGSNGGGDEVGDDLLDLAGRHLSGSNVTVDTGSDGGLADEFTWSPTTSVVELDDGEAAVGLDAARESRESGKVVVTEAPELTRESLSDALDVAGTGHGETEATFGPVGQPGILFVAERPIGIALLVGERGQHEAIGHGRAMEECNGIKR
jgi:hypothetical protein